MSYQAERDSFLVRMDKEGLPYDISISLLRGATTLNRLAELSCSSEAADKDRVLCPGMQQTADCLCDDYPVGSHAAGKHQRVPRIDVEAQRTERRLASLMPEGWAIATQGDPRGYCLKIIPPSYKERNTGRDVHNLESIGVPPRESGIRW